MTPERVAPLGLIRVAAAWLLLYLAVGGALGCVLAWERVPWTLSEGSVPAPCCWPALGLFDTIETQCSSGAADAAWFAAVGLPRLVLGGPVITTVIAARAILRPINPNDWALLGVSALFSMPALAVAFAGFAYWWRRSPLLAVGVNALLLTDLGTLVLQWP